MSTPSAAAPALSSAPRRPSDRTLARLQAASGLTFAVFLAMHLASALSAIAGAEAYAGTLAVFRQYYRFPLVEVVLVLGAALIHVGCGVTRILRRRAARRPAVTPPLRERLHRASGYFLLLAFVGHVVATRGPSLIYGQDPDLGFLHLSLTTAPYFFYPYYALLGFSGGYHLVHGALVALKVLGVRALPPRTTSPIAKPFWAFSAVWAVAAIAIVLAFGGVLFEVDDALVAPWRALLDRLLG